MNPFFGPYFELNHATVVILNYMLCAQKLAALTLKCVVKAQLYMFTFCFHSSTSTLRVKNYVYK